MVDDQIALACKMEQRLLANRSDIDRHIMLMKNQADTNCSELTNLYKQIREILQQRENAVRQHIKDCLQKEEALCNDKQEQISDSLQLLADFQDGLEIASDETDI